MSILKKPCPCGSGQSYGECCQPWHKDPVAIPTPEQLMRSRYTAFYFLSRGELRELSTYLVRTIHADHPDAKLDPAVLAKQIREGCAGLKYMGLNVTDGSIQGDRGSVTFQVKMFERGKDRSFTEKSEFVRTVEGWKYLSGEAPSSS